MIRFFYEIVRKQKSSERPYWKLAYKINKALINFLFPLWQWQRRSRGIDEESKIIVSLTTYPARIDSVWITIASLLEQTMKPCKIILWLAEDEFSRHEIPKSLERQKKRGLEIRFCDDLKPHKKYYYTMQEYPEHYIITADDDVFYPENHVELLWMGYKKHPNAIICHWSHQIPIDRKGGFKLYNEWAIYKGDTPLYGTLAVGCNGVLYPPGSLPKETFAKEKIFEHSLYADDLWLKCMEILNGWKTINCNAVPLIYFSVLSTKKSGLWKINTGEASNNDITWNKLMKLYPEVKSSLLEEKMNED